MMRDREIEGHSTSSPRLDPLTLTIFPLLSGITYKDTQFTQAHFPLPHRKKPGLTSIKLHKTLFHQALTFTGLLSTVNIDTMFLPTGSSYLG